MDRLYLAGFYTLKFLIFLLPTALQNLLAKFMAFAFMKLKKKRFHIVMTNLDLAFGETKTKEEKLEIAKKCYYNFAKYLGINFILNQNTTKQGNTGALMATARFVLKTIPGIERPAIAKFLPSDSEHVTLALDLGANVDCTPEQLVQFAIIGSELVHALHPEKGSPRVALLNVGTEDIKGTDAVKQTFKLLSSSKLNFIGNIESNSVLYGEADVVVADGFVGNVMLKTIEGAVKFMSGAIRREFQSTLFNKLAAIAALPALKGLKGKLDPRKFNGAILLGLRGIVIKSHGGTDEVGFRYALEEAYHEAKSAGLAQIEQGVATQLAALETAKAAAELEETATPATET